MQCHMRLRDGLVGPPVNRNRPVSAPGHFAPGGSADATHCDLLNSLVSLTIQTMHGYKCADAQEDYAKFKGLAW